MIVYELAEGGLNNYKRLDFKGVFLVAIQIWEELKYFHSIGIVHGDLKSYNILPRIELSRSG